MTIDEVAMEETGSPRLGQENFEQTLTFFWHPVCTTEELAAAGDRPLRVTLLGRDVAVARLASGSVVALADRCVHRSARLSVGWVDGENVRCGYHGWAYGSNGRCTEIPSMPESPVPARACVPSYDVSEQYGLVWVRLDGRARTTVPAHPSYERLVAAPHSLKVLKGAPYTWPVAAPRRVENFVDLAHFAWVHDGTLGRRDEPVPPLPGIDRVDGEMRFAYDPPDMAVEETALFGHSEYRMPMPLTVSIEFWLESGAYRHLWMTASPVDMATCRAFWTVSRDDDLDGDDTEYMRFQQVVLDEDEPLVCNQVPREMILEPGFELSVRTDKVSIEYRRWLGQLVEACANGPAALHRAITANVARTTRLRVTGAA